MKASGRQVRVVGFVSRAQAELARSYLAQHGVYAFVVADDAGDAPDFSTGAEGVSLTVPASQVHEARRLLSSTEGSVYKVRSTTHRISKALVAVVVVVVAFVILIDALQRAG